MTTLKRALNQMPADIRDELESRGLHEAYDARPPYQRNDYLGWIGRAKKPETRRKRIDVMLSELSHGTEYMGMKWNG